MQSLVQYSSDEETPAVQELTKLDQISDSLVLQAYEPKDLGSIPGCDPQLQEKFSKWRSLQGQGLFFNKRLEQTHSFRNPLIVSKLIEYLGINEHGTNFSSLVFDPSQLPKSEYLAQIQIEKAQASLEINEKTGQRNINFTNKQL